MVSKKMIWIFVIMVIVILIFSIFKFLNYKKVKMGNTIVDKTLEEIEEYILNISSYDAELEIVVESNKNTNKYIINQKYESPNIAKQEVIEPENIKGLTVNFDGNNLEISNSKLSLNTIYENYTYIADNVLWLSDFIENYKNNGGTINEKDGIIIMETKKEKNKYYANEKLYIDRNANKITKLVIEDENKKNRIYITYNKIKIGSMNKKEILAFKFEENELRDI
jgi:outer membrane lipoprotein-sorting protein